MGFFSRTTRTRCSGPFADGTKFIWGNETEEPTMCGLCAWAIVRHRELPYPHVYVNRQGQPLSKADLDNLMWRIWLDEHADYNQGDWWIVCHSDTSQYIHDFVISHRRMGGTGTGIGVHVDEFHSKIGKTFPMLSHRFMRPKELVGVDFDALGYGYSANDSLESLKLPTQGRYQRWLITFQTYGVVATNRRANIGIIYGLSRQ